MVKLIICIKKNPEMSRDEFIDYYEKSHVVLAKRLLGHLMVRYVRNYPRELLEYYPEEHDVADGYDAITEMVLKDEAAYEEMNRICSTPENAKAIMDDEEVFQVRLETRIIAVDSRDTGTELLPTDRTHENIIPRAAAPS